MTYYNLTDIFNNVYSGDTLKGYSSATDVLNAVYDPTQNALRISVPGDGSGITALSQCSDVLITNPTDTQVLTYTGGSWKNINNDAVGITKQEADTYYLSANTSFYTQAQANQNFLSASTLYLSGFSGLVEEKPFQIEITSGINYFLDLYAPYSYVVNTIYIRQNGTAGNTLNISLSGGSAGTTAIGGLTSISGNTGVEAYVATSNNTISTGHQLKMVVNSATSGATMLYGTIKTTRV